MAEATPWPLGVVWPPPRPKLEGKKKKKEQKKSLASRGGQITPYGLLATLCFFIILNCIYFLNINYFLLRG
jgi:hypothetical protein